MSTKSKSTPFAVVNLTASLALTHDDAFNYAIGLIQAVVLRKYKDEYNVWYQLIDNGLLYNKNRKDFPEDMLRTLVSLPVDCTDLRQLDCISLLAKEGDTPYAMSATYMSAVQDVLGTPEFMQWAQAQLDAFNEKSQKESQKRADRESKELAAKLRKLGFTVTPPPKVNLAPKAATPKTGKPVNT